MRRLTFLTVGKKKASRWLASTGQASEDDAGHIARRRWLGLLSPVCVSICFLHLLVPLKQPAVPPSSPSRAPIPGTNLMTGGEFSSPTNLGVCYFKPTKLVHIPFNSHSPSLDLKVMKQKATDSQSRKPLTCGGGYVSLQARFWILKRIFELIALCICI